MSDGYDLAKGLVTKLLETKDVRSVLRHRHVMTYLETRDDADTREVLEYVLSRYQKKGRVPSLTLVKNRFPDFEPEDTDDSIEEVLGQLADRRIYADMQSAMATVAEAADGDPRAGLEALATIAGELSIRYASEDVMSVAEAAEGAWESYISFENAEGMLGLPWLWPRVNKATKGMRPKNFDVIYGDPGTQKTWLLLACADHIVSTTDAKVFMCSGEMGKDVMLLRLACYRARLDYERFLDGALTAKEKKRYRRAVDELKSPDLGFYIDEIESTGLSALTEIRAKVQDYGCTSLMMDSFADLSDSPKWEDMWMFTRGIKMMLKSMSISGLCTHHTNRDRKKKDNEGGGATDVALGDALLRRVDGIFRLIRTPQDVDNEEIMIVSRKVREGKPFKVVINAKPAVDFSEKYVPDEDGEIGEEEDEEGITG